MEAYERGLIGPADTGGLLLQFGDPDAMLAMVEQIAFRQGLGALLAEGVWEAARRIGGGAEELAVHVDPRGLIAEVGEVQLDLAGDGLLAGDHGLIA